jgi:hypothetical protein
VKSRFSKRQSLLALLTGDLYGPYSFKPDETGDDEDAWVHEACVVWSPNIYVSNNKLFGLSGVIENSLNMVS